MKVRPRVELPAFELPATGFVHTVRGNGSGPLAYALQQRLSALSHAAERRRARAAR